MFPNMEKRYPPKNGWLKIMVPNPINKMECFGGFSHIFGGNNTHVWMSRVLGDGYHPTPVESSAPLDSLVGRWVFMKLYETQGCLFFRSSQMTPGI